MSIRSRWLISASILVLIAAFFVPRASISTAHAAAPSLYTMTSFSNSSESNMYVYLSNNGLNFTRVGTAPAYTPPSGIIRDPSVTVYGGRYYVTYTDGWSGNSIGLASSPDRVHWTFVENITFATTVNIAWAPEWFKDTDGSGYYELVNRNSGDLLSVNGASTANGASIIQGTDQYGTNQQWSIVLA